MALYKYLTSHLFDYFSSCYVKFLIGSVVKRTKMRFSIQFVRIADDLIDLHVRSIDYTNPGQKFCQNRITGSVVRAYRVSSSQMQPEISPDFGEYFQS